MRTWVRVCAAGAVLVAFLSGPAWAQEDLEKGKSAAQLFASDCGICHKSAQALVKDGYPTEAFLRVHYASSREMAAALFTYLRGIQRAEAASGPKRGKPKANASKQGEGKPGAKPKTPEPKASESAPGAKAAEPKPAEKKSEPKKKE